MRFGILVLFRALSFYLLGSAAVAQTAPVAPAPYGYPQYSSCTAIDQNIEKLRTSISEAGLSSTGTDFKKVADQAGKCLTSDEQQFPDDEKFNCADFEADSQCKNLIGAKLSGLKDARTEAKQEEDDADKQLREDQDKVDQLKKDAADYAKTASEEENQLLQDLKKEEDDYQTSVEENDKKALDQIQSIQAEITKIQDANRQIVLQANKALADAAKQKLAARTSCRDAAKKDYAAKLKALDDAVAARGGKVSGGFEGVQNYENYRKFLVDKITNPEPSEQFSLCYANGDQAATALKSLDIDSAINMNAFASQIDQNNKQRDQLIQNLQQQQQQAQQQKTAAAQRHAQQMQLLNQKYVQHQQAVQAKIAAMKQEQSTANNNLQKSQQRYRDAKNAFENADTRYACVKNKAGTSSKDEATARKDFSEVQASYNTLVATCRSNPIDQTSGKLCNSCSGFTTQSAVPAPLGGGTVNAATSSSRANTSSGKSAGSGDKSKGVTGPR